MEFKEKFVAFIDVLGFKEHVKKSENGSGMPLQDLLDVVKQLGSERDRDRFVKHGPTTCPHSAFVERDLDFRVTQISDCAIVSAEISPAGLINLISHCWGATIKLLRKGILCRGYITRGTIYHSDSQVLGSGYQAAYERERTVSAFATASNDSGTPFVEVDPLVCDYIDTHGDDCVRTMFARMTKSEDDLTALFPFQSIGHGFIIDSNFRAAKEMAANEAVRTGINLLKNRITTFADTTNDRAMAKIAHYIRALDRQLELCDRTDVVIRDIERGYR
jgi:hypothetical protein